MLSYIYRSFLPGSILLSADRAETAVNSSLRSNCFYAASIALDYGLAAQACHSIAEMANGNYEGGAALLAGTTAIRFIALVQISPDEP